MTSPFDEPYAFSKGLSPLFQNIYEKQYDFYLSSYTILALREKVADREATLFPHHCSKGMQS
jgi:hypothetical protein